MALMTQIPTTAQLIKQAIENRLLDVHTAIIGRIERYDHQSQLADIQPVLKRQAKDKEQDLPLLLDVPVLFPRAGGFFLSLPIQSGDFVQVIFNETDIDDFLNEPSPRIDSVGRFTLQGAVAIPGIQPSSKPILGAHKTNFVMGQDNGVQIHLDGGRIRLGSEKANQALALASAVKTELEKIRSAFQSHVHTGHGAPTTTQITPIGDIATKKVVAL